MAAHDQNLGFAGGINSNEAVGTIQREPGGGVKDFLSDAAPEFRLPFPPRQVSARVRDL